MPQLNKRRATCLGCGKPIPKGLGVKVRCNWARPGGPYRGFVHEGVSPHYVSGLLVKRDLPDFRFEILEPWSPKYGMRLKGRPGRQRTYATSADRLRAWRARPKN